MRSSDEMLTRQIREAERHVELHASIADIKADANEGKPLLAVEKPLISTLIGSDKVFIRRGENHA